MTHVGTFENIITGFLQSLEYLENLETWKNTLILPQSGKSQGKKIGN